MPIVLVVCGDRALQQAVRELVAAAGGRTVAVTNVAAAQKRLERLQPSLVLTDPAFRAEAAALGDVVAIPVRVSATGVRRLDGGRSLRALVAARCRG